MSQLVSHFILPEDDDTSLLAAKGMLKGERGVTIVTRMWKFGWQLTITNDERITELFCREFHPIDDRGEDSEPSTPVACPLLIDRLMLNSQVVYTDKIVLDNYEPIALSCP